MNLDHIHFAQAPIETATMGYWIASQLAPRINTAPAHAQMALQTLVMIAAARPDRIGDHAAARFHTITGREVERPFPRPAHEDLPPAA